MKKTLFLFVSIVISLTMIVSCIEEVTTNYDETLLYGKWQSGSVNYKYISDGTGTTWDTADDVAEDEAQAFTWTLVNAELTHIYVLEIGGNVPKVYTITQLTATSLIYEDDFGTSYTFTKVN
ncbi:MAG: hypothetical protein ACERKD_04005 [Prolixibacteraceae bacterium]